MRGWLVVGWAGLGVGLAAVVGWLGGWAGPGVGMAAVVGWLLGGRD